MDDELLSLLIEEIERRSAQLERDRSKESSRSIAHALKGALGLAGERESSDAFARVERRILAEDPRAVTDLSELLSRSLTLLKEGRPLPVSTWPDPPQDLRPPAPTEQLPLDYIAAVHDRAARIDAALAGRLDAEAARAVYREVHTVKGAALAVGDDLMAWFCHGLEERLKSITSDEAAKRALEDVDAFRGVLVEIVEAPDHAIETLRLMGGPPGAGPSERADARRTSARSREPDGRAPRASRPPYTPLPIPPAPRRPAVDVPADSDARSLADADTVRVSTGILDGLFERAGQLGQLKAPLSAGARDLSRVSVVAREVQRGVREALRMIGPPRPWGAPAAAIARLESCAAQLQPLSEEVDAAATQMGTVARRLSREGETLSAAVQSLRTSFAATLLERLALSAQAEAGRVGKTVHVTISGGDMPVDRRILEALVDPMRQLVRNAVAHGIETPEVRLAAGKSSGGTLRLAVVQRAGLITLAVEDDGAGVDVAEVRERALSRGLVTESEAAELDDGAVLALLFSPGFSLRQDADLLAGRGVGLDLTLAAVQRLGGAIHLDSRPGHGLSATITLPAEASLARVVWLECAGEVYALPVHHAGTISRVEDWDRPMVPLAKLLAADESATKPPHFVVEVLSTLTGPAVGIGVEAIGAIDEVALRALPSLVRAIGPFGAGIIWAEDLRLSLDPRELGRLALRTLQRA